MNRRSLLARNIFNLILVAVIAAVPGAPLGASAETDSSPAPTSPPAAKKASGPLTAVEIYSLASDMNRINYSKFKYRRYLSELIFSLERLVDYQCAPSFKLSAAAPKMSDACAKSVDEVLSLDEENPVAICARDGSKAKSCAAAFNKQFVGTLSSSSYYFSDELATPELSKQSSDSFNVEYQLAQSKEQELRLGKDDEARRIEGQLISDSSPSLKDKLQPLYSEILHKACKFQKLKLAPESEKDLLRDSIFFSGAAAEAKPTPLPGSVEDLISQFSKPKESPTPQEGKERLIRLRLLGPLCSEIVQRAARYTPDLAAAICYRDGWNSPNCLSALDRESRAPKTSASDESTKASTTSPNPSTQKETGLAAF